jgi:flagellar hook assembly protein FlgD
VSTLYQNFPNPFNPATTIAFDLQIGRDVTLIIYDVAGGLVRTLVSRNLPVGRYTSDWNGTDDSGRRVASGIYFYRLHAGGFVETRKMVLLK